jgi:hypothetical protein
VVRIGHRHVVDGVQSAGWKGGQAMKHPVVGLDPYACF